MQWKSKESNIIKDLNQEKLQNFIPSNDINESTNLDTQLWSIQQIQEYISKNVLSGNQSSKNFTELYGFQGDMTQTVNNTSSNINILTDIHFSHLNIQQIDIVKDSTSGDYLYEHAFYFKIYYASNEQISININQNNLTIPQMNIPQSTDIFSVYKSDIFSCDILQETSGSEDITQLNGVINDFILDGSTMTDTGYCDIYKIELVDFQRLKTT